MVAKEKLGENVRVRMTDDMHKELEALAEKHERSMGAEARIAIREHLKRENGKRK